jgi:DDE superfamily endonuclease
LFVCPGPVWVVGWTRWSWPQPGRPLQDFAGGLFSGFARSDQRVAGVRYLRGLMLDGKYKSMQTMVARLGMDHRQLQHFLTSSTWLWSRSGGMGGRR